MTLWGKIKNTILVIIGVTPVISLVWLFIAAWFRKPIIIPMALTILPGLLAMAIFGNWSWWESPFAMAIIKKQKKNR